MAKIKQVMRPRRMRYVLAAIGAAIPGVLLITGCGSGSGGAAQLVKQYPWLPPLGLSFIQGLLQQYGSDLVALLATAAAALFG
jgi:hypothetical protein